MGEIAEMMLDGDLCEQCGVYMGSPGQGFPRKCKDCRRENRKDAKRPPTVGHDKRGVPMTQCATCSRRVKLAGINDHMRDAHGVKS